MAKKTNLNIKSRANSLWKSTKTVYSRHQGKVLGALALAFVALIIGANFLRTPEEVAETPEAPVVQSAVYEVGNGSLVQTSVASVENQGTVTLVAQTAGPISNINYNEGDYVKYGAWITQQTTGYATGSNATVTRQIAEKNLELAKESLDNTVKVVSKNRELADRNRDNTEQLRQINNESIDDTENLLDQISLVIDQIEADIEASNDPATIQALRSQLISFQANFNQTQTALDQVRYTTDTDEAPTAMANINKDLVYLTTEIQLKSAEIQRDIAQLNLRSAQIAEAITCVKAPFAGVIDRILVKEGQYVTPGTPVAVLSGTADLQLVTNVSGAVATRINSQEMMTVKLNGHSAETTITHVSTNPTNGQLFQVIASVPAVIADEVFAGQSLTVTLPLISQSSLSSDPVYVPLNSVFVTNTGSFVYVLEEGIAKTRYVETGTIVGNDIQIESGLLEGDQILLNRQLIEDQTVEVI